MKKLSFCITCKNRLYQISKTLPVNLYHNLSNNDDIEFVLFDFGSNDGLQKWIISNFKDELTNGYLSYFYTDCLSVWHASKAKNTAHYYSRGEILVNLDCDNYTGKDGGLFVLKNFDRYGNSLLLHQFSGIYPDGSFGRIGMKRGFFIKVGGYDESFLPMGYQDVDILKRLYLLGLNYELINDPKYNRAIPNTKNESMRSVNSRLTYKQMNRLNYHTSNFNINNGRIILDHSAIGIRENIYKYQNNEIVSLL